MAALRPLSRIWLGTLGLAAVSVVAALVVATRGPTRSVTPSAPVTVRASFDRSVVGFGDRVSTQVVVLLDRSMVDTSRLHVAEDLAPLQQLSPTRVTRTELGRLLTLSYDVSAACLDDRCLARREPRRLRLAPVTVTVPRRAGGTARMDAAWPVLDVRGRVAAVDLAPTNPPLKSDVAAPSIDYWIKPSTLVRLLEIVAAVLAAAGVALAGRQVWLLEQARRARAGRLSEIERALALAREAGLRPPADRRRALGLLARLLRQRNERLAGAARELAWSEPAPTPDAVSELVTQVEREVNGR